MSLREWWLNRQKGILNDEQIEILCQDHTPWPHSDDMSGWFKAPPMIKPFFREKIRCVVDVPIISKGLGHYGYDLSLGKELKILAGTRRDIPIDPKDPTTFVLTPIHPDSKGRLVIPPLGYALGVSLERFVMPENVMGICLGKSTYARVAADVNLTPLEPGWRGWLTLEISNDVNHSIVLYPGEGIAQVFFLRGKHPKKPYSDGKYQDQGPSPTHAKV